MLKRKPYLTLFIIMFPISAYSADIAGFNEICNIYTEAQNSSMSREQISDYIQNNIQARVQSVDALDAHGAVFQLEPANRYSIFKKSAEISLKHSWYCDAVKNFMK